MFPSTSLEETTNYYSLLPHSYKSESFSRIFLIGQITQADNLLFLNLLKAARELLQKPCVLDKRNNLEELAWFSMEVF